MKDDKTKLLGQQFGQLTVIAFDKWKGGEDVWQVRCCACGREVLVSGRRLARGQARDCGCSKLANLIKEVVPETI